MIRFTLLILLGWVAMPSATYSQNKTYAVVVGISDYKALTYRTGDLRFADRDARQVAAFLRSKSGGHVPTTHLRVLTNAQATRKAILRAMAIFGNAKPTDRVILYFSGHGAANGFIPYDVLPGQPTSILTHELAKQAFRKSKAQTKLCIADACLSGGMTRPAAPRPSAQAMAGKLTAGTTIALLLAGKATQLAVEDRRVSGGLFTFFVLKGLRGEADTNRNRVVTIRELHSYVSPRVRRVTQGHQSPVFYGSFPDSLVLAHL